MQIIDQILVFLILMLVGLALRKTGVIDENTGRKLSTIVIYVASPALIINSSQADHTIPDSQLLSAVLIAAAIYAALILFAAVLPRILRIKSSDTGAYAMMTVFSNIGFMGIPLVSELFGQSALLYVSVFSLLYSLLMYSYGVVILQRGTDPGTRERFKLRKLVNPGVLSSIAAVLLYLLHIRLPEVCTAPLGYLSNLTAPLSMMLIGVTFADINVRSFLTDGKLLVFSALKLLVLPILGGLLLKSLIGAGDLLGVCLVMISTPVGSMTVMMAQHYGGDLALLSKGVTLTTLLCVATIPLVFLVLM